MSTECNIRLQGYTGKSYTKSPNGLLNDYRVSDKAFRLYDILLDAQFKGRFITQEYLAKRLKDKDGEPVSVRTIIRLMNELKKYGWLCLEKQTLRNKETGEVKTIAEYVLFWQSATAPKSNTQLLEEQAADMAKEQAELETEYEGYQSSLGGEFDNLAAELEEQVKAGAIVIGTPPVQEEAQELIPVPPVQQVPVQEQGNTELAKLIAFAEQRLGRAFSDYQKQAIARNYAIDKAGTISQLQDIMCLELKAKQG